MTKTYDEMMKLLDEKKSIPDDEAARLIQEHGPLDDEEKKKIAAAIKMAKALGKSEDKAEDRDKDHKEKKDEPSDAEITMDDYLVALSILDADAASKEDREKAQKVKDKFEGQ
jgi:hypothetical protein